MLIPVGLVFGWIESNHAIIVATEIMKAKEYL
jgi:hypothetical protein